jgi:hypothetical protein
MTDEYQIVDEVARETADILADTEAVIAWKADGDGAYVLEPSTDD